MSVIKVVTILLNGTGDDCPGGVNGINDPVIPFA
jgi:hypothetical protein